MALAVTAGVLFQIFTSLDELAFFAQSQQIGIGITLEGLLLLTQLYQANSNMFCELRERIDSSLEAKFKSNLAKLDPVIVEFVQFSLKTG